MFQLLDKTKQTLKTMRRKKGKVIGMRNRGQRADVY